MTTPSLVVRRIGAGVTVATMVACLVPAAVVAIAHRALVGLFPPDFGASVALSVVGAVLLVRGADRRIAGIMCVQGITTGLTTISGVWREVGSQHGPLSGAPLWAAWVDNFVWIPGVALLTPLVLLFPNGRLHSRRWRWPIIVVGVVASAFAVGGICLKFGLEAGKPYAFAPNPTGFLAATSVTETISSIGFIVLVIGVFVSLGSLISRRRRAVGVERLQLTCLLFGATTLAVLLALVNLAPQNLLTIACSFFVIVPLPVSVAVAVSRFHLFEIDRVVSRTLTYAVVVALLAGVYIGVLASVASLVPARYGKVGVALATLVVTVLALPLTRRVRHAVDRRFDRARFNAEHVINAFATRVRAHPDLGDVPSDLMTVVQRTVAPQHASVWLIKAAADG